VNEGTLTNVRREASRYIRNRKREYLKDRINKLGSNGKNKNIRDLYRGINEFKKAYQPRTNLVKDLRGDLLAEPHKIFNRWNKCLSQLLNVSQIRGVKQAEMHTAQPFVPEASASEVEVAAGKLKSHKSPDVDQIPAEMAQAGHAHSRTNTYTLRLQIHKLSKLNCKK
jgi:hypothetical protein